MAWRRLKLNRQPPQYPLLNSWLSQMPTYRSHLVIVRGREVSHHLILRPGLHNLSSSKSLYHHLHRLIKLLYQLPKLPHQQHVWVASLCDLKTLCSRARKRRKCQQVIPKYLRWCQQNQCCIPAPGQPRLTWNMEPRSQSQQSVIDRWSNQNLSRIILQTLMLKTRTM